MNILENRDQLVTNNTTLREQVLSMVRNLPEQQTDPSVGATATAEDIREGKTACVNGQLLEGLMSEGLGLSLFGCTKFAVDKFTFSTHADSSDNILNHSLNDVPKYAFLFSNITVGITGTGNYAVIEGGIKMFDGVSYGWGVRKSGTSANNYIEPTVSELTNTTIRFYLSSSSYKAGEEYTLITMA